MGVQISGIIPSKEIELITLSGKKVAIDAFNICYQFLSIIRDRMTGEPLRDSKGRVTSHLSGLLYRTTNLIEAGIKPIFVFDGEPPRFKKKTIQERAAAKEQAKKKWKEAVEKGEPAIKYAQAASKFTDEMIKDSKQLLDFMGVPWLQAPSEGEAQCTLMAKKGDAYAVASQDFDSLLFGSPILVRNLSITGRRKLPKKEVYIDVKPEIIELEPAIQNLGINQKQLILLGILVGTDYNIGGVKGFGPKRALELVKEEKTFENVKKKIKWEFEYSMEDIFQFFLEPPTIEKYDLEWKQPNTEKIIEFMVEEHDFSRERVEKVIEKLQAVATAGRQASLKGWFEK
jgi:flap endonuclease-1